MIYLSQFPWWLYWSHISDHIDNWRGHAMLIIVITLITLPSLILIILFTLIKFFIILITGVIMHYWSLVSLSYIYHTIASIDPWCDTIISDPSNDIAWSVPLYIVHTIHVILWRDIFQVEFLNNLAIYSVELYETNCAGAAVKISSMNWNTASWVELWSANPLTPQNLQYSRIFAPNISASIE